MDGLPGTFLVGCIGEGLESEDLVAEGEEGLGGELEVVVEGEVLVDGDEVDEVGERVEAEEVLLEPVGGLAVEDINKSGYVVSTWWE